MSLNLQRFKILLRAIGLGLLARYKQDELPKILVYKSRLLTLGHFAIHLLPAGVSFALIAMNFQGRFIGTELQGPQNSDGIKLGFVQVAAKLHVRNCLIPILATKSG